MSVRSITGINCKKVYNVYMVSSSLGTMPVRKIRDESIIAHFSDGVRMQFSGGETIINGLEEPEGVYLIKEGFVKAHSVSRAGLGNLLLIHEPGEFIPLPWALDGAHTTGLFYQAMSDVTVLRVSKDKLRDGMGHNPWLAQEISRQAVAIITVYTQRIQTLQFRSARGRIIAELISLAERFGKADNDKVLIEAPITHQDIADSINMTRETASRALELLFEEGLMGQTDHLFTVRDISKLRAELK